MLGEGSIFNDDYFFNKYICYNCICSVQKTEDLQTHKEQKQLLFWQVIKNNFYKYFYILFCAYICLNENAICFVDFFN